MTNEYANIKQSMVKNKDSTFRINYSLITEVPQIQSQKNQSELEKFDSFQKWNK